MFLGCLQSVYGMHTFRLESIAYGKAAPIDELQVQGVYKPGVLRKVNPMIPIYFSLSHSLSCSLLSHIIQILSSDTVGSKNYFACQFNGGLLLFFVFWISSVMVIAWKIKWLLSFIQIIVTEASKAIQDVNRSWRPPVQISEERMVRMGSSTEGPAVLRSPSKSWKVIIKLLFL